jgi:hypothetical protein
MKLLFLTLTLLFSGSILSKQKYYKWTDAKGIVHFTEKKPENKEVKEIKVNLGKSKPKVIASSASNSDTLQPEQNISPDQAAVDEYNAREKERVTKQQNAANCKIAKKNLATLQATVRVRKKDPTNGEIIRMDDNQRMAALKNAKDFMQKVCK